MSIDCRFQPTPPVSTEQLEAKISQSADRIVNSIDSLNANIATLVQLASDPRAGIVIRQQDGIALGFNRAMVLSALRDELPEIINEMRNPTVVS